MATNKTDDSVTGQCRRKSLLDLSIVDLNIALATSKKQTEHCKIHTEQYLYFYCKKCHEPVCRDCTVVNHKDLNGHRIFELKDIYQEYSTKFSKQREVADTDKKDLENCMKSLQKKIEDLDFMKRRLKKEIEDDLKKNIKALKERALKLCEEIYDYCDTKKESFQSKLKQMGEVKDQIGKQLADFESVRKEADAISAFRIYRELKEGSKTRKININRHVTFRELQVVYEDEATFQRILQNRGKI